MKLSKSFTNTALLFSGLLIWILAQSSRAASEFEYFGSNIDYWNPGKPQSSKKNPQKENTLQPEKTASDTPKPNGEAFTWNKYLDPRNKEFFKEGDYTPPEPFMEIARNPTDANLKLWFAYIEKKNQLSTRLQVRMKEYMEKNGASLSEGSKEYLATRANALPKIDESLSKRYRFRMYFNSHCPHCKRMFATLSELQSRGFYVEARQIDNDTKGLENLPIPIEWAQPGEVKEKNIQNVPLLLVGDLEKKAVYRLSGFQTVASIFQAISQEGSKQ